VWLGVRGSLVASALLHALTVACFIGVGMTLGRGVAYMFGVAIVAALLIYEHSLVRPSDLSKLNRAFFDLNGYVSVAFLICVALDHWLA
jgi:4-hydroxybenzoate polyprenyltransferase